MAEGGLVGHVAVQDVERSALADVRPHQPRLLVVIEQDQLAVLQQFQLAH